MKRRSGIQNIFENIPSDLPEELVSQLVCNEKLTIERIVSLGHSSPKDFWYDQPEHEFVILLSGSAHLLFEGENQPIHLNSGDFIEIKAHARHRVDWTDPNQHCIWLTIRYKDEHF